MSDYFWMALERTEISRTLWGMEQNIRSARLETRVRPDTLSMIQRAAELQGRSVSDFVVEAAQAAAHRAIDEAQIIRLSLEDQSALAEAILDPPEPNEALRRAVRRHREMVRK